jgi:acylphosphatase
MGHCKITVSGRVQGVGFRYFVSTIAKRLKLNGYARNLYTGEVEIEVEGAREAMDEFVSSIRIGPPPAHVSNTKIEWGTCEGKFKKFEIL